MSQRSTAQHHHTDTPFCTIRKSHVTWNFAVPVPHSEEIRRCILLFLCTLAHSEEIRRCTLLFLCTLAHMNDDLLLSETPRSFSRQSLNMNSRLADLFSFLSCELCSVSLRSCNLGRSLLGKRREVFFSAAVDRGCCTTIQAQWRFCRQCFGLVRLGLSDYLKLSDISFSEDIDWWDSEYKQKLHRTLRMVASSSVRRVSSSGLSSEMTSTARSKPSLFHKRNEATKN